MKKRRRSVIPNSLKHDKRTKEVSCQYSEFLEGTQCSTKKKSRVQCKCPDNSQIYTVRIINGFYYYTKTFAAILVGRHVQPKKKNYKLVIFNTLKTRTAQKT